MRMTNQLNRRSFYVIQFVELPFETIDDYVCVPYSWLIVPGSSNGKVVVTYPSNEDPFDTKERVKRKEKPNDDWRLYMAVIKYESDDYTDAEFWIATRNSFGPGEEQSKIGDTQPESVLDKKIHNASQPLGADPNSNKPQLTVKPQKNPRIPLPRLLIRRPPSQSPDNMFNNKRLKLNENENLEIVTDHTIIESECSKQEQTRIITGNQLIQNDKNNTHSTSNGEMNTERSTKPEIAKENQPVNVSVQSSLEKNLTEQQPSQKLSVEQQSSPNIPAKQHSTVDVNYQQPLNMSVVDLNKPDEVIKSCQNTLVESVKEERTSIKTPMNTVEQTPQPKPIKERSTVVVRYEQSLPESYPQDLSVRKLKKPNDSQNAHLNWNLTAPKIIQNPSNTTNQPVQQYVCFQFPILPVNSTLYSNPNPREMVKRNSIKMIQNPQIRPSQVFMPTTPSTSHEPNWEKFQLSTSSFKKQTPMKKSLRLLVEKKTLLANITKNITRLENVTKCNIMQCPPHSTMQHSSPTG